MDSVQPKKSRVTLIVILAIVFGGFFFVVVPLALLVAIPTMGNMKRYADETSAQQSIRAINMAETQYSEAYPEQGYACSLQALGGDPHAGQPTAASAQVLQPDVAGGEKAGYSFTIANCVKTSADGGSRVNGYQVVAKPLTVGKTGNRTFCSDQTGKILFDPAGGTNCTQVLQ